MRTKFLLIEREGYHPQYTTADVVAELRDAGLIVGARPVTQKEIKAERIREFNYRHHREMEAFEEFRNRMHRKPFKAKVLWFDLSRGVGVVDGLNGEGDYTIYACNIKGKRTWYPETACVFYMKGEEVDVELEIQYGATFCIGLTQGYPDNEKWESLDQDRLAFKCDENGKAINGLFA